MITVYHMVRMQLACVKSGSLNLKLTPIVNLMFIIIHKL